MTNLTKRILSTLILLTGFCFVLKASTNVSGGIYSNTTWTKANSPYIVVDTVVVFPNVILTIEPGTVVKFADNKYIEIRNSTLIANGNSVDSITFTSNSLTPAAGIWKRIMLNNAKSATSFNFVNIMYASDGIKQVSSISYIKNSTFTYNLYGLHYVTGTPIDSCNFKYNGTGINYLASSPLNFCTISNNTKGIEDPFGSEIISNCTIDSNQIGIDVSAATFISCTINYNQTGLVGNGDNTLINCTIDYNSTRGLDLQGLTSDSIANCEIKFNGIGITAVTCTNFGPRGAVTQCVIENNSIGIQVGGCSHIYCNTICNNSSYDVQNLLSTPFSVQNNYWCTSDSATIEAHIYDGYDNINLGLVSFMPLDTIACNLTTGIQINKSPNLSFNIFPNPASDNLTLFLPENNSKATIKIYNLLCELNYTASITKPKTDIDVSAFASGIYIIEVSYKDAVKRQKFIKE